MDVVSRHRRTSHRQVVRFALVGSVNVAVSFVVFVVCYRLLADSAHAAVGASTAEVTTDGLLALRTESLAGALANMLGYVAGMVTSFVLNKTWTFEADGNALHQFRRFLFLNLAGLLLSTVLVFVFVDRLGGPHIFVWLGTTCLVMVVNFVGNKFWTFADALPRGDVV